MSVMVMSPRVLRLPLRRKRRWVAPLNVYYKRTPMPPPPRLVLAISGHYRPIHLLWDLPECILTGAFITSATRMEEGVVTTFALYCK